MRDEHIHIGVALVSFFLGGGGVRVLIYISKNLAPLPKDAGFWMTSFYNCVKGLSGLDPNSAIVSQSTLKAMGLPTPTEGKT